MAKGAALVVTRHKQKIPSFHLSFHTYLLYLTLMYSIWIRRFSTKFYTSTKYLREKCRAMWQPQNTGRLEALTSRGGKQDERTKDQKEWSEFLHDHAMNGDIIL
jgi:hypothetical protein